MTGEAEPLTPIPIRTSTMRFLEGLKAANEDWDQFLIRSFEHFVPPEMVLDLVRREVEEERRESAVVAPKPNQPGRIH